MTTEKNTIKIQSYFGEKDFTKEQFVKRWTDWSVDFGTLCSGTEDWDKYTQLRTWSKELAERSFDRASEKENK